MTYADAITKVEHEIFKKQSEIETLRECIKYLENETKSNDNMTQPAEKILGNFGVTIS